MTDEEALRKILDYGLELQWRDYRGALARWESNMAQLELEKPIPPTRTTFTTEDWT